MRSEHADLLPCGRVSDGTAGEPLLGRSLLPEHPLPDGLSFQAAEGARRASRAPGAVAIALPSAATVGACFGFLTHVFPDGWTAVYTGELHVAHLPLQREQQREHLSGYSEGPVEPGAHCVEGAAVDLLAADGPESGRSAGA